MEMSEYASRVGFRILWVTATSETNRFLSPFVEILEAPGECAEPDDVVAGWDSAPEFATLRRACAAFFSGYSANRWTCRRRSSAVIFFKASQRDWRRDAKPSYVYVLEDLQWRRILSGAGDHLTIASPTSVVIIGLSRRIFEHNDRWSELSRIDSPGYPSAEARRLSKDDIAQMLHGLSQARRGKSGQRDF